MAGSLLQNLRDVNRERHNYADFLRQFATSGESMKLDNDEFDYVYYTYGMMLYKNMPLIEPLEYKDVKKAFKRLNFSFDILPAEFTSGKVSVKKAEYKKGKLKLKGLSYTGGAKKIKLKIQKGSKGDFTATLSGNSAIIKGVNNFTGRVEIPVAGAAEGSG